MKKLLKNEDYDVVIDSIGSCGIVSPVTAVFNGDDQYNGCTYP